MLDHTNSSKILANNLFTANTTINFVINNYDTISHLNFNDNVLYSDTIFMTNMQVKLC